MENKETLQISPAKNQLTTKKPPAQLELTPEPKFRENLTSAKAHKYSSLKPETTEKAFDSVLSLIIPKPQSKQIYRIVSTFPI